MSFLELSIKLKTGLFEAYAVNIFLVNCEIWTVTKCNEDDIDVFQRRIIQTYVLNVQYPRIFQSEDVYRLTNQRKWSFTIEKRD